MQKMIQLKDKLKYKLKDSIDNIVQIWMEIRQGLGDMWK